MRPYRNTRFNFLKELGAHWRVRRRRYQKTIRAISSWLAPAGLAKLNFKVRSAMVVLGWRQDEPVSVLWRSEKVLHSMRRPTIRLYQVCVCGMGYLILGRPWQCEQIPILKTSDHCCALVLCLVIQRRQCPVSLRG